METEAVIDQVDETENSSNLTNLDRDMLDKLWRIHGALDSEKSRNLPLEETLAMFVMAGVTAQTLMDLHRTKEQALRILRETDKVALPLN